MMEPIIIREALLALEDARTAAISETARAKAMGFTAAAAEEHGVRAALKWLWWNYEDQSLPWRRRLGKIELGRLDGRRPRHSKKCEECGNLFGALRAHARFCSTTCCRRAKRRKDRWMISTT